MGNFSNIEGDVSIDEHPREQFIQVMHDASQALENKNPADLKIILEHARSIVDALDEGERSDALDQINELEDKLAELNG